MDFETSNSKWITPAVFFFLWALAGYYTATMLPDTWKCLSLLAWGAALICGVSAVRNHFAHFDRINVTTYEIAQKARMMTPETILFDLAQHMHPETVRLLLLNRKRLWQIKRGQSAAETADWILFDAPTVHAGFVTYFLDNSTRALVMSKRLLAEGSKKFDPEGQVEDRQQYDDLVAVLQKWMVVTQPFGKQTPPAWIAPYDPELLARELGLWQEEPEHQEEAQGGTGKG